MNFFRKNREKYYVDSSLRKFSKISRDNILDMEYERNKMLNAAEFENYLQRNRNKGKEL